MIMAEHARKGFIFDVSLTFDYQSALGNSVDLGPLPYLRKVYLSELSQDQINEATNLKRRSETTQLISTHDSDTRRVEFTANLMYLLVNCSFVIKEIHAIVIFEHEKLLAEYLQFLQDCRKDSTSPLEGRLIKSLGNNIPGKFHQNLTSYQRAVCVTTEKSFLRKVKDPNFVDFLTLSADAVICLFDGLMVKCTNIPAVSAWCYAQR